MYVVYLKYTCDISGINKTKWIKQIKQVIYFEYTRESSILGQNKLYLRNKRMVSKWDKKRVEIDLHPTCRCDSVCDMWHEIWLGNTTPKNYNEILDSCRDVKMWERYLSGRLGREMKWRALDVLYSLHHHTKNSEDKVHKILYSITWGILHDIGCDMEVIPPRRHTSSWDMLQELNATYNVVQKATKK